MSSTSKSLVAKPAPKDWPRISCGIFYEEPARAIPWLCAAFGFDVRLKVEGPNGRIEHSELVLGDGLVMVGTAGASPEKPAAGFRMSPRALGGANTQSLCVYIDDVDAHCARARAAGAQIAQEPKTVDYGPDYWSDRTYEAVDLEGHHWWFMQRLKTGKS